MKKQAITIFAFAVLSISFVSGIQYAGDVIEKIAEGINVLNTYFVLIALFAVYKGQSLFSSKQLRALAYSTITIMFVCYFYPVFKYWEQDSNQFLSPFLYDFIINNVIATILLKESMRGLPTDRNLPNKNESFV